MKALKSCEKGAIAIEALFGLTFFILAVLAIMFMALIVRVQSNMQYALGQTAKEISGYYYLIDKVGLADLTTGVGADVSDLDETIGRVLDFAGETTDAVGGINLSDGVQLSDIEELSEDADPAELYAQASQICEDVKALSSDPVGQIKAVLSVFGKSMVNRGISNYVAPFICQVVMPKYLSGDTESTDEYLESVGILGGMDSLDFRQSQLLADGRSIKLAVTYTLNTKELSLGMVDIDLTFKQAATTAAWIKPVGSKKKLAELSVPTE